MRPNKITSGATGLTLTAEEYAIFQILSNGIAVLGNETSTLITNQAGLAIQI